nr:hypothetical protein [Tanacetum cinerariifolium]
MSNPPYVDSETITQADKAQSSRVPVPLLDDPYVVVRQAQLVDTNTESDPKEAPSEAEESQPLSSRVPLMSEEFEASEPLGLFHPILQFHRIPPHHSRIKEATALSSSSFRKRYRFSYETPSPSSSPTLLARKRYRERESQGLDNECQGLDNECQGLDEEGQGLEDEGPDVEEEDEATHKGQLLAVLVVDTAASKPLGLGYGATRCHVLDSTKEITPSMCEVGQSSRVYIDIPTYEPSDAPVQTSPSLEWSLGSLPVSPSSPIHLDALPPALFEGYNRDLKELYTRSGAVRDEIFSQRYSVGIKSLHEVDVQYENFAASSKEVIKQTYERLHGEVIPQEEINQKFLRSLSQEWTMHTIVWRNKLLSLDDLFNNLKAYELESHGVVCLDLCLGGFR